MNKQTETEKATPLAVWNGISQIQSGQEAFCRTFDPWLGSPIACSGIRG